MSRKCIRFIFKYLVIAVSFLSCCDGVCDTFKNNKVLVFSNKGKPFHRTVSGCVNKKTFEGEAVTKLFFVNQKIPQLKQNSLESMPKLNALSFVTCNMDTVYPGAFKSLPRLAEVSITYSSITEIPKNVFNYFKIERLQLMNNKIDHIQDQAFSSMPNLTSLQLNNNEIEVWNKDWVYNSSSLELLDLTHNKIKTVPRQAFKHTPNIKTIIFNHNEISNIQAKAFEGLQKLEFLGLSFNKLTFVRDDIITGNMFIKHFQLNGNILNFIPNKLMQRIGIDVLTIDGNPFSCQCLHKIIDWVSREEATLAKTKSCKDNTVPLCVFLKNSTNECAEKNDDEVTKQFFDSIAYFKSQIFQTCINV